MVSAGSLELELAEPPPNGVVAGDRRALMASQYSQYSLNVGATGVIPASDKDIQGPPNRSVINVGDRDRRRR